MTVIGEPRPPARPGPGNVPVHAIAWAIAAALFGGVRLAGVLSIPVFGAEIDGLAGAWQAHAGNTDARFAATFFQAVMTLLFDWSTSEVPPRALAFLASATIPLGVYRLRPVLGEGGALAALLVLAIDAPGIAFGTTATASGFDLALTVWLMVLLFERNAPLWAWGTAGFLAASSGPVWLPLAAGVGAVRLFRQDYPSRPVAAVAAGGAVIGLIAASLRFGLGWDGLRIPPLDLFAAGFDQGWSTESTGYLAVIYLAPAILGALGVVAWEAYAAAGGARMTASRFEMFAWTGVAGAWLVAAAGEHTPVPLAALSLALAFVLGPAVARAVSALWDADWAQARYAVPAILGALAIAAMFLLQWARTGRAGDGGEQLAVGGMMVVVAACTVWLAMDRGSRPALLLPAAIVLLLPAVAGLSGVAFGSPNEPLLSPVSPLQAREIRDIVVGARAEQGGLIAVHPRFEELVTWPFRDSGELVIASGDVPEAVVIIWPDDLPAPQGYSTLDGRWTVQEERRGPDAGVLDYLRWLANRNTLPVGRVPVIVYLKAEP